MAQRSKTSPLKDGSEKSNVAEQEENARIERLETFKRMTAVNANVQLYEQQVTKVMQSMECYKGNIEELYLTLESQYSNALKELEELNNQLEAYET